MLTALEAGLFCLLEEHAPVRVEGFQGALELAVFEDHLAGALAVGVEGGAGELLLQAAQAALGCVDLALDRDEASGEYVLLLALTGPEPPTGPCLAVARI